MLPGRKLSGPEEIGVPVARSTLGVGPKLPNGSAPPKPPTRSPSPKLPLRATQVTPSDDTARRPKKPPSPQRPPAPKASPGPYSSGAAHPPQQSPGDGTRSPTSPSPGTPQRGSCGSAAPSPAHTAAGDAAKAAPKAKSGAGGLSPPQDTDCGADLPEGSRLAKLKSAALEPGSTTSPPPAKKLALSAKKVSPRRHSVSAGTAGEGRRGGAHTPGLGELWGQAQLLGVGFASPRWVRRGEAAAVLLQLESCGLSPPAAARCAFRALNFLPSFFPLCF